MHQDIALPDTTGYYWVHSCVAGFHVNGKVIAHISDGKYVKFIGDETTYTAQGLNKVDHTFSVLGLVEQSYVIRAYARVSSYCQQQLVDIIGQGDNMDENSIELRREMMALNLLLINGGVMSVSLWRKIQPKHYGNTTAPACCAFLSRKEAMKLRGGVFKNYKACMKAHPYTKRVIAVTDLRTAHRQVKDYFRYYMFLEIQVRNGVEGIIRYY